MPKSQQSFKLVSAFGIGQPTGEANPSLVGRPTVVPATIEGRQLPALLDTGATVSTITQSVADQLGLPIVENIANLNVECANGQQLPYLGCVVANVTIVDSHCKSCLFLVVPNASSSSVPVLLGTNNLEQLIPGNSALPGPLKLVALSKTAAPTGK